MMQISLETHARRGHVLRISRILTPSVATNRQLASTRSWTYENY